METCMTQSTVVAKLPDFLRPFFWDYDFKDLSWDEDWDLIIKRLLTSGDWKAVIWLRSHLKDSNLREWIIDHRGAGLSPQRLRFWELILEIPHRQVNLWLKAEGRRIWEKRLNL
jgi:hypothetical protein